MIESTALGGQAGIVTANRELPGVPCRDQRGGTLEPSRRADASSTPARPRRIVPSRSSAETGGTSFVSRTARRSTRGRSAGDRCSVPSAAGCRSRRLRGDQRLLRRRATRGAAVWSFTRRRHRWRQLGRPSRNMARPRRRPRDLASPSRGPARDDVRLSRARARALRRRGTRPQRDRLAPRSRRPSRGGHPEQRGAARRSRSSSSSSARAHAPNGSTRASRATNDGFVLTGAPANAEDLLETSIPGVFAAGDVRSGSTSAARPQSAKARWPSNSRMPTSERPDAEWDSGNTRWREFRRQTPALEAIAGDVVWDAGSGMCRPVRVARSSTLAQPQSFLVTVGPKVTVGPRGRGRSSGQAALTPRPCLNTAACAPGWPPTVLAAEAPRRLTGRRPRRPRT